MPKLEIKVASTSQTVNLFIQDSSSSTGAGLAGLVFNSAGLTAYYALPRAAAVSITLATLAAVTSAYSSGGFKEIDATNMPGWYRFDIPDAALASGRFVSIHLKGATNMAPLPLEIELAGWDNQDGVRGGLTALPNAAAEAAGGLYTRGTGAGQINQAANGMIDTNPVRLNNVAQSLLDLKDFADDGYDPTINKVQGVVLVDTLTTYTGNTPQTGDAFARLGAPVGASTSADIAAMQADTDNIQTRLPAALVGGRMDSDATAISGDTTAADNLEKEYDGTGYGRLLQRTTIATLATQISFTLTAGSADDNAYNGCVIVIEDAATAAQKAVGVISAYTGLTKTVTLLTDPAVFTMAVGDIVTILADRSLKPAVDNRTLNVDTAGSPVARTLDSDLVRSATAQAGAATSITLDASASAVDDFYRGLTVRINSGTGTGQARVILAYNGTSKVATVDSPWATNPDGTSIFALKGTLCQPAEVLRSNIAQAGAAGTITLDTGASAIDDFYNDARVEIVGGTGVGQIRRIRDYVGATKVATVVPNWTTNPAAGSVFLVQPETSSWDETIADHLDVGTTGEKLNAASAAGDPWTTALPGAYGAGTAGFIVGNNLDAPVSAVPTAVENADALLDRNMATGVDSGSSTVRTPRQALRLLRNFWDVVAGVLTVRKEDDTAVSWTAVVSTDAAASPITGSDPAG
jgi:hypothetical protein